MYKNHLHIDIAAHRAPFRRGSISAVSQSATRLASRSHWAGRPTRGWPTRGHPPILKVTAHPGRRGVCGWRLRVTPPPPPPTPQGGGAEAPPDLGRQRFEATAASHLELAQASRESRDAVLAEIASTSRRRGSE